MTLAGKTAFLDAIANGKGFIGIHSAADTFHTGETAETNTGQVRSWRYRNLGDKADPYIRMLGAEFIVHGMQQVATVKVIDPKIPGFRIGGSEFSRKDEWYSLTDFFPRFARSPCSRHQHDGRPRGSRRKSQSSRQLETLSSPTLSVHLGTNAWKRPCILHIDGTWRQRP